VARSVRELDVVYVRDAGRHSRHTSRSRAPEGRPAKAFALMPQGRSYEEAACLPRSCVWRSMKRGNQFASRTLLRVN
jgi:hypothetical protein